MGHFVSILYVRMYDDPFRAKRHFRLMFPSVGKRL